MRVRFSTFLVVIALLASTASARADDKPVVYDHITKGDTSVDQAVNDALALKYTIVPIQDSPAYVGAKVISGAIPHVAKTDSGEMLKGSVLVAYVITPDGGPDNCTYFYSLYLYNRAWKYLDMGYASAMAWILFVVIIVLTAAVFRTQRRWVHYGG